MFPGGTPAGTATPFVTRRHVHGAVPQARPAPQAPTGIDYLGLVAAAHDEAAGTGAKIDFSRLPTFTAGDGQQEAEQLRCDTLCQPHAAGLSARVFRRWAAWMVSL